MTMFTIKDEKGNYASSGSFQKQEVGWMYVSYTGWHEGMRYYPDKTGTIINVITRLRDRNDSLKAGKEFKISEIKLSELPNGEMISQYIS